MDLIRKIFDEFYGIFKPFLFYVTRKDHEIAHDWFILFSKILMATGLEKFVLDNKTNYKKIPFEISNGAGLDKNANISPMFFRYGGLDRIVYGTFTGEKWPGNSRPRTKRLIREKSLLNNIGWENDGSEIISNRLKLYKNYETPITISIGFTPTPELSTEQRLKDLEKTLNLFNDNEIHCISRVEYNPSCPNLKISREENQSFLVEAMPLIKSHLSPWQELDVKVSSDLTDSGIEEFIKATFDFVNGYVTTNATTQHDFGDGAGSGDCLYELSLEVQKKIYKRLKGTNKNITACGGINSFERAMERIKFEPQEKKKIQILTPLFYEGFGLLRKLKTMKSF